MPSPVRGRRRAHKRPRQLVSTSTDARLPKLRRTAPAERQSGAHTEAQYRAHMNLRKDAMARLASVFIQDDMVSCPPPVIYRP